MPSPPPPEPSPAESEFPITPLDEQTLGGRADPQRTANQPSSSYVHPLAHSASLIEVIHDDKIDVEEEARFYHDFDQADERNTPVRGLRRSYSAPSSPTPSHRPSSVFSHDIWVEGTAEECTTFAHGVTIGGWTSVGDKLGGAYVVYDCAIRTHAGTTMHVHKRYSAFAALRSELLRTLPAPLMRHIPPLPPRAPWARFRPAFLEKRRRMLQRWLAVVLLHPEIGGCVAVREWVVEQTR